MQQMGVFPKDFNRIANHEKLIADFGGYDPKSSRSRGSKPDLLFQVIVKGRMIMKAL